MAKMKLELNGEGVRELLKEVGAGTCRDAAEQVAGRAEGNWDVTVTTGKNRSWATVKTDDKDTFYRNLHTNTLLKALGGGG